jgi:hypothetical protein
MEPLTGQTLTHAYSDSGHSDPCQTERTLAWLVGCATSVSCAGRKNLDQSSWNTVLLWDSGQTKQGFWHVRQGCLAPLATNLMLVLFDKPHYYKLRVGRQDSFIGPAAVLQATAIQRMAEVGCYS